MYFIGSGALLNRAVNHCLAFGFEVDGVCCPPRDPACEQLRKKDVSIVESLDPNIDRALIERKCSDGVIFSINNKHILGDDMLGSGIRFYNVHNGLVQQYRGIAEVCIFASLCMNNVNYGVTLQRLLPGQDVDAGSVVSQLSFVINPEDGFANVFEKSLRLCQEVFELNVKAILSDVVPVIAVDIAATVCGYNDVVKFGNGVSPERLQRASDLGHYSVFLPKLQAKIKQIYPPIAI